MDATLTDRYVQAVIRSVPERQQADVAAELRTSIADQIDARAAGGEPPAGLERAVLEDLGDPDALAAGFADRPLQLIGPRYFLIWWRLLKVLLWIVPACALFGVALGMGLSGAGIGEIVGTAIGAAFGSIVHVAFWTTLVFAIVERTSGAAIDLGPWTVDRLPEPRESGARLSDMVASIVFLVLLAGAIGWDLSVGFVHLDGRWMSVLNPQLWPIGVLLLLTVMVLEVVLAVMVFLRGRWTAALAVANAALAVCAAGVLLIALGRGALLNPAPLRVAIDSGAGADLPQIIAVVVGVVVVGVAVWDIVDAFVKAHRARADA